MFYLINGMGNLAGLISILLTSGFVLFFLLSVVLHPVGVVLNFLLDRKSNIIFWIAPPLLGFMPVTCYVISHFLLGS